MLLYLQIALTLLSAICVALILPLGAWLGFPWAIALALAAVMFFMLMKLCKQTREMRGETSETDTNADATQEAKDENQTDTDEHI